MAGVTAQGGTFTFAEQQGTGPNQTSLFTAAISGVSVETPVAEIADMSSMDDQNGVIVLVPTGDWSGGSISVDYIRLPATQDPQSLVRKVGYFTYGAGGYSVTRRAILESASSEIRVGEIVRGSLRFRITDYSGTWPP